MLKGALYAAGLELNFFESNEFEVEDKNNPHENAGKIARNALRLLMMGWRNNWKDIVSARVLIATLIKRDRELVKEMRLAFQQGFEHTLEQLRNRDLSGLNEQQFKDIFDQSKDGDLDSEQLKKVQQFRKDQFFLSNCMTLLPYADITPYESFTIPQFINGEWQRVDYKVTPIELTPTTGFKKLFINDDDRVFAYGLEPLVNEAAEPHLIFMGTTYPSGQGFNHQVANMDSVAFETPGKNEYRQSRDKISKWLDKQAKKVHVCGTSLGGSLTELLLIDQGKKISRADPLDPTGLYEPWQQSRYDHWDWIESKPQVIVQKQGNDPVSAYGVWKKEWHVVHVQPPADKQGPNAFVDHALNYGGLLGTEFVGLDTDEDNAERKTRNFWIFVVARALLYYFVMMPYRHVILPLVRYVLNHKLLLVLTGLLVAFSFLVPMVLPAVTTAALLVVACTPLAINLAYKFFQAMLTIFGWNEVTVAKLHDPSLPRNESMDIYTNEIEETFTYKEIQEYYRARRCILKDNKAFVPDEHESSKVTFNNGTLTKRDVLEKADAAEFDKIEIKFTGTKAKIFDIKQTVRIMNRIGFYQSDEQRKEALQEQHEAYTSGKETRYSKG